MSSTLQKLDKEQLLVMTDIMSDAFMYHSNFVYLIESEKRRKKALMYIFHMMYKVINEYGFIFRVHHEHEAIAYITYMDDLKSSISLKTVWKTRGIMLFLKFLLALKLKEIRKFQSYMKSYQTLHESNKAFSIHLYATGIKKEFRGKRLMSKPFRESFEYFKDLGYSYVNLETSDISNIALYEKMGFTIQKQVETIDGKQTIYFFEMNL